MVLYFLVSVFFKVVIWVVMGFGWFPWFLKWFHGFWLVPLVFLWFLFFHVLGFHVFINDMCHVEKTPKRTCLNCARHHNKLQISVICEKLCKLRTPNGDPAFKKAVLNTFGPGQWWLATPDVMFVLCPLQA